MIVIQTLTHAQLGCLAYGWPRHWALHANAAAKGFEELSKLHERLVKIPVHESTVMRNVDDPDFVEAIYHAGTRMVTEAVMAVQHLCQAIEADTHSQLQDSKLDGRLREALEQLGVTAGSSRTGYDKFIEIEAIRDALEHPKAENVYNGQPGQWDRVPMAWFLSDRSLKAFEGYSALFKSIVDDWQKVQQQRAGGPISLEAERGVYSQLQYKKPPKS